MKKLILLLLPAAIFLAACQEPTPPPQPKPVAKHKAKAKSKSENPEDFRAVEKPSSYGQ